MRKHSTKVIHFVYVILLPTLVSSSFSQVVIRDTVTITPKNILLNPKSVVATTPVVDVSFQMFPDQLIPGSLLQITMPDKTWVVYADQCTGRTSEVVYAPDMGMFPETGTRIGNLLFSDCYEPDNGSFTYTDYISPDYGSSTQVGVNLVGIGADTRYVGYFTYEKPPLPTIQLQHGAVYISQEVHPIIDFTPEYSPLPGEKYASVLSCTPSPVIDMEDYVPQVLSQGYTSIFFSATATNPSGIASDTTTIMVLGLHHFALSPPSQSVDHGQTCNFYVQAEDIYNNVIDNFYNPQYSTDYPYDIPLMISWSPDTLGEVIIPPAASVAAKNTDLLGKASSRQKLQLLKNSSSAGQKNNYIKILSNPGLKKTSVSNGDSYRAAAKKLQSSLQTSTSSINCTYFDAQGLEFVADGKLSLLPDTVTITVTSMDGSSKSGTGFVIVSPPQGCPSVVLSSDHINLGDTIDVTVKDKIDDTTYIDYPAGTLFDIYITDGEQYGDLLVNGDTSSVGFDSVTVPIKFIATDSLNADSVTVSFSGAPDEASFAASRVISSISKTSQTRAQKGTRNSKKFMAVAKISTCSGPTSVTIKKAITKISVDNCLGEILYTGQTTITVTTSPGTPPDDLLMNISVGAEGTSYTKIKNLRTQAEGTSLTNVLYSDLKNSQIVFMGNGTDIPGKFPLGVRIIVSSTIGGKPLTGTGSVFIRGSSASTSIRYTQNNPRWGGEDYDSYMYKDKKTGLMTQALIGDYGCALTDWAMILTAEGTNYTPLTLNQYLTDNTDFGTSGNVDFPNLPALASNLKYETPQGIHDNYLNGVTIPVSGLDSYLNQGDYVLAQVINQLTGHGHWVIVTGKNNGIYSIIDPGGSGPNWCANVSLDAYQNKIFRAQIYSRIKP